MRISDLSTFVMIVIFFAFLRKNWYTCSLDTDSVGSCVYCRVRLLLQSVFNMEKTILKPYDAPITLVTEMSAEGCILVYSTIMDEYEAILW
jgi:hypothetical protein